MRIWQVLIAVVVAAAGSCAAKDRVDPVNRDRAGVAIQGYDPVAYFTEARPAPGLAAFTHEWMGATWRFASAAHRDQFAAAPERYAPQFGGYCAWAVGHGYTANIDPAAWKIVNGKLYLNYSKDVQAKWAREQARWIAEAEKNWPGLRR